MGAQQAVLVLDDEYNFSRILEAKLQRSGFRVVVVPDAAKGIATLLEQHFDLVLLDVRLPDANGLDLLPHLHTALPGTTFILMTAFEEEGLRERALNTGAASVLYKPFDLDFMVQTVRLHIAESARTREARAQAVPPLITPSAIALGQAVVMEFPADTGAERFVGTVSSRRSDTFNVRTDTALNPQVGGAVTVQYSGEDGLYEFRTRVVSAPSSDGGISLAKPRTILRSQRRKHPRVPLSVPVRVTFGEDSPQLTLPEVERSVVSDSERNDFSAVSVRETTALAGMSRDVGQNGMALLMPGFFESGIPLTLAWTLPFAPPTSGAMQARGTVVRCEPIEGKEPHFLYQVGVRFSRLSSEARARLSLYIATRTRDDPP